MKGEKGQVSYFKPMQIDTDLGYDVYKIFINVTSLNEIIRSVWTQHRDSLARLSKKR